MESFDEDQLKKILSVAIINERKVRRLLFTCLGFALLGAIIWKWYILPIALLLALVIGSFFSYRATRNLEKQTGLTVDEIGYLLKMARRVMNQKH